MKRTALLSIMMAIMLTAGGCSGNGGDESAAGDKRQDVAVTTTFLLDMVEVLDEGADAFDTELIIPAGVDPHTYQPKASNLTTIVESDILFYQGLNFEGRMADVLTDGIPVAESFWFNIELYKEAMTIVKAELSKASPDHEEIFQDNMEDYFRDLDELDSYVRERLSEVPAESRILITPHDAFGYLSASYDLDVHAPQGFSTASEVSNNTISMTADIIMERDVKSVFVETTTNPDQMRRLEEIVSARGGTVNVVGSADEALYSDSLGEAGEPGDTYIGMYRHNIDTIVENLK